MQLQLDLLFMGVFIAVVSFAAGKSQRASPAKVQCPRPPDKAYQWNPSALVTSLTAAVNTMHRTQSKSFTTSSDDERLLQETRVALAEACKVATMRFGRIEVKP